MYVNIAVLCLLAFASIQQITAFAQRRHVDGLGGKMERIISGLDAKKSQFPWQISFQRGITYKHEHICGGSILNSRWVLTAAHCIIPLDRGEDFFVVAGISNLKTHGQVYNVKNIIVHPGYISSGRKDNKSPNDIALVELDDDLVFGPHVGTVTLPEKDAVPNGTCTLSGWGGISRMYSKTPDNLQTVDLPVLSHKECENALVPFMEYRNSLTDVNICTGQNEQSEGGCHGDSGGPLCTKGGNTQIGIASRIPMGYCGFGGAPTIFTRVSAYIDWILEHID